MKNKEQILKMREQLCKLARQKYDGSKGLIITEEFQDYKYIVGAIGGIDYVLNRRNPDGTSYQTFLNGGF